MRVESGSTRKTRKRILSFVISLVMVLTMMVAGGGTELAEAAVFAGGEGSSGNPYIITDAAQLNAVRNYLSANFVLADDIDLTTYLSEEGDGYNAGAGWLPIGDWDNMYSGTFDGAGHTINGLAINRDTYYNGLFGVIGPTGVIRNLGLTDVSVESSATCNGSLAGGNCGIIENCSAAGAVSGVGVTGGLVGYSGVNNDETGFGDITNSHAAVAVTGNGDQMGGLAGQVYYGDITDSYATGNVSGGSDSGGLVGILYEGGISGCHATGNVTAPAVYDDVHSSYTSGFRVGGLVGECSGSITSSYATGDVDGGGEVGGLVGKGGSIANSYATGAVTGTIEVVGGLVGCLYFGNISQCYAAGAVTGPSDVGGLVGANVGGGDVLSSFYAETTGQSDTGKGVRKTTIEMKQQATYTGWNFTAATGVWRIIEGYTYPVLQWQPLTTEEINAMISMDRAALAIAYAAGDSAGSVTQNLTLPTAGAHGTVISWSSSNTAAVADNGTVTRPSGANSAVTLTATISLTGGTNQTRDFVLTVIKQPAVIVSTLPATLTEAAANDGSLASGAVVITIAYGTLLADIGKADVTASHLPAGLDYTVTRTDDTHLTITITGKASSHANADDLGNLAFTIGQTRINGAEGDLTTGSISIDWRDPAVTYNDGGSGGGGGGGTPTASAYNAGIAGGGNAPVTVDTGARSAAVNLGATAGAIFGGQGNTVVSVPSVPGVDTYTVGIPASALSSSGAGSLTLDTDLGSVTIPGNMLSGMGLSGDAGITIGEGDKENLPDEVKAALGDRPIIQLTLSVNGTQTNWNNPDAPVTVSVPYAPTAEELANPEHIVVWYIDGSGTAVSVPNGRYDPATGTVTFSATHFSYYAVAYDPVIRLAGTDRIETALAIARAAYPGKISSAVLATAVNFPDSLAGSVLAYKLNAPILLVGSSESEQEKVRDYLKTNLDPQGTVYILGGTAVVGSSMEGLITASGFKNPIRIAGGDRYETSVKIAEQLKIKTGTPVLLVSGENYPDALSVSSIAAQKQFPILLVQKDGISEAVRQELAAIKPGKVYIIGRQEAISSEVDAQVSEITGLTAENIIRIGGADRFATSLALADYLNLGSQAVCVATGDNFPDALAGSVYAAKEKAPIILMGSTLSEQAANYLSSRVPEEMTIFGGEAVVGKDIEQQIRQLLKQ